MSDDEMDELGSDARRAAMIAELREARAGLGDEGRTIIGQRERPAVLYYIDDDDLRERLVEAKLAPSHHVLDRTYEVDDREFDLLVTDRSIGESYRYGGSSWSPSSHMYVVSFADIERDFFIGKIAIGSGDGQATKALSWGHGTPRRELAIPKGIDDRLRRLVERDLLPRLRTTESLSHLRDIAATVLQAEALLMTRRDDLLVAGFLKRAGGAAEVLALPPGVQLHEEWIVAAMDRWREQHPDRFVHLPGWQTDPAWATAAERDLLHRLVELEAEHRDLLDTFDRRKKQLERELAHQRAVGARTSRRLLASVGDDLVEAVGQALKALGFVVEDRDATAESGRSLEDLRVTDPAEPGWVALVEVRGPKGAATPKDLPRLTRWATEYAMAEQKRPDALWYLVNQLPGRDPAARPLMLQAEQATLDEYADEHSLLAMDTACLFRMGVAVEEKVLHAEAVRRCLRDTSGRITASDLIESP